MIKNIVEYNRVTQLTLGIVFGIVLGLGVQIASAAWSGPEAAPPEMNVPAPINVGLTPQYKEGSVWLNTGTDIMTGAGALANGLIVAQGNVGVGILSPTGSGGVVSSAKAGNVFTADLLLDVFKSGWSSQDDVQVRVGDLVLNSRRDGSSNIEAVSDRGANGNLVVGAENDIVFNTQTTGVDVMEMYIKNNGNVGIGKTDPVKKLDVAGAVAADEVCIGGDCRTAWPGASNALLFGGVFQKYACDNSCRKANPATGSCSCPAGYSEYSMSDFNSPVNAPCGSQTFYENKGMILYMCYKGI